MRRGDCSGHYLTQRSGLSREALTRKTGLQFEGLPAQYYAPAQPRVDSLERIARAEAFFAETAADIRSGGNMAYYSAGTDHVQMPPFECFRDAESYYASPAHEMTQWTKHPKRLDRDFGRKRFGDEGYAMEELVAELSAAFLSANLDLTPEVREIMQPMLTDG